MFVGLLYFCLNVVRFYVCLCRCSSRYVCRFRLYFLYLFYYEVIDLYVLFLWIRMSLRCLFDDRILDTRRGLIALRFKVCVLFTINCRDRWMASQFVWFLKYDEILEFIFVISYHRLPLFSFMISSTLIPDLFDDNVEEWSCGS